MSVRVASVSTFATQGNNINQAADTIFMALGALNPPLPDAQVMIFWYFACLIGAGWTNVGFRIRRGTALASTVINATASEPVTPATQYSRCGVYTDNPGPSAGLTYSLSILVTGGAGIGTCTDGCMFAICL